MNHFLLQIQKKKNELIIYLSKINYILNIPAIYVSHSVNEIFTLGNKINFIKEGKVFFSGNKSNAINYYNRNDNNLFKDSFVRGEVVKTNPQNNLTDININGKKITVFSNDLRISQKVLIKIKSSDIIISREIPKKISSLNFIKVNISEIIFKKGLVCLILTFGSNILKADLTLKSYKTLNLKIGNECYAIIKALNINDIINISMI